MSTKMIQCEGDWNFIEIEPTALKSHLCQAFVMKVPISSSFSFVRSTAINMSISEWHAGTTVSKSLYLCCICALSVQTVTVLNIKHTENRLKDIPFLMWQDSCYVRKKNTASCILCFISSVLCGKALNHLETIKVLLLLEC